MRRRPSFLSGQWYPSTPEACRDDISQRKKRAPKKLHDRRGVIVPHAGWTYSGDAAIAGFCALPGQNANVDLVVIFGSHRGPRGPNSVFLGSAWQTPLGDVNNAEPLAQKVAAELHFIEEPLTPTHPDNAVEVLLPFVKYFCPQAEFLMIGIEASLRAYHWGQQIAHFAQDYAKSVVVVGSTDLTHYGPNYNWQPMGSGKVAIDWVRNVNDRGFIDAILEKDAQGAVEHALQQQSACCPGAAVAALGAADSLAANHPELITHYLSCDVQTSDSFVGYGAIAL